MGGKSIMKKYVDGKYVEMTEEEIEALKDLAQEETIEPTILERIEAIEAVLLEGVLLDG